MSKHQTGMEKVLTFKFKRYQHNKYLKYLYSTCNMLIVLKNKSRHSTEMTNSNIYVTSSLLIPMHH